MEYTADNFEKAVTLFYRSEPGQQQGAHQWLTEAQNSPQAWSFVWELLNPQRSSEVQFFAATTLHTKLLKFWNEVPEDHYEILKKKILEAIISYASGPKIVLNRLCITLSAYIIHTVPNHWPNAFEELVSSFQPQHLPNIEPERVIWILLEILTVIPEEFQSSILVSAQRNRVKGVLQQVSKDILKVVEMCLVPIPNMNFNMSNLTTYLNATKCASAWIQLGGVNIDECSVLMSILIDLTCFIYWNKEDPEGLNSEELEVIEVALEAITSLFQNPNTHKYENYIVKITESILQKFTKVLKYEHSNSDPNKDVLSFMYTLIVTIADSHSKVFIDLLLKKDKEENNVTIEMFKCILDCANIQGCYPTEETCSSICLGFWYTLQDDVLSMKAIKCAQLLLIIKPFYRELVCIMLRKSMFPDPSKVSGWSLDDKEVFRCYRQDISDTYMYCYNVLNLEMLDILSTKLNEALNECTTDRNKWNLVESCLHAFSAIAESIEIENLYLPKFMEVLKEIPYSNLNSKILSSALDCVAAYSEWITDHSDLLGNVVPLVVAGISNPDVCPSATMALKDLTQNCQKLLRPYADHIIISCQFALQSGTLKLTEHIRIMYSLGKVLGILSCGQVMEYLNVILGPSFEEIQRLLNSENETTVTTTLITRLKILSPLFSTLHVPQSNDNNQQQPLLLVVQNTMPLYKMISRKYCHNTEVIDVLCGLLKYTVTTLVDDCKPLITDILEIVVSTYREVPQASILVVAKTIIIMFGKEDQFVNISHQVVHEISNITLIMCAELNATNQLSEKTDVIEGFFSMLAQLYKKNPQIFQSSSLDMTALFQCAIMCMSMPEVTTVKVCSAFLVNFIMQSREAAQSNIVQMYGESLVLRVLLSLGGATPRACIDILSDIFLVLNKKYCDNLSRWMQALLYQEGFPSPKVTMKYKENFIKLVLREKVNKRKLSEAVAEFSFICRGLIHVDSNS